MRLEGIHHVTAITADAPRNVDFYARVLGLRLVKRTVNQDDPTVYHLFYADEDGDPGSDLTFFEYPHAHQGRPGAGMIHRVAWRVGSADALDFWWERLTREGIAVEPYGDGMLRAGPGPARELGAPRSDESLARAPHGLRFTDPDGLGLALVVSEVDDEPLIARSSEVPDDLALQGIDHVRAYTRDCAASAPTLDQLGFSAQERDAWEARGARRGGRIVYDRASEPGSGGAGTVHHVAWASRPEDHERWRERVLAAGANPTPVIDRFYFRSIYFREPSGVLFELATIGPGFTVDEPLESLGERLSLPPRFEPLREQLRGVLTPLPDASRWRRAAQPRATRRRSGSLRPSQR